MNHQTSFAQRFPAGLLALATGAFGIGLTEFVIMGLLPQVSQDLGVSLADAGLLISGYAMGVVLGAPLLTLATSLWPQKHTLLLLMLVFTLGNMFCALATDYTLLMLARVITAFAHGTFFGVGALVATRLVAADRGASAIAIMFTGLTVANVLGVPFGTWLGQVYGWRTTFWAVALIGIVAFVVLALFIPANQAQGSGAATSRGDEIRALWRLPVLLGLLMTVLGFGGSFALLTFIAPLLTDISGFSTESVPPILVLFGLGVVAGNLLGGRVADRFPVGALFGSFFALVAILALLTFTLHYPVLAVGTVFLLGVAAFSTCAPLQMWVMSRAKGGAQTLVSSLNIAAFNLGNAIGAAIAGLALEQGGGLISIPLVAALMPLAAIFVMLLSLWQEKSMGKTISTVNCG